MGKRDMSKELLLAEVQEGDELRAVSALIASSVMVIERSCGPDTQAAYGSHGHGHKVLCEPDVCSRVLSVCGDEIERGLRDYFAGGDEVLLLSDFMDALDVAGESYSYLAWTEDGDAVMRLRVAS